VDIVTIVPVTAKKHLPVGICYTGAICRLWKFGLELGFVMLKVAR
jgi:hypothetical protein